MKRFSFHLHRKNMRLTFFLTLIIVLLPAVIFPLESFFYHSIFQRPAVRDSLLELAEDPLTNALVLDGQWEFYYDRWIVTEGYEAENPDFWVAIPGTWWSYPWREGDSSKTAIASYRLRVKNGSTEKELIAYIPNANLRYRVFIDGKLVDGVGGMKDSHNRKNCPVSGVVVPAGETVDLVIEIEDSRTGGLSITPVLAEKESDHLNSDYRNLFAAALVGILAVTIGGIACLTIMGDKLFGSFALLTMDVVAFIRILFQNDYLSILQAEVTYRNYVISSLLQTAILFLPVAFLLCVRQLVHIPISRKTILFTVLYELLFTPLILWNALNGRPRIELLFSIASYLPFAYIMWRMYQSARKNVPYTDLVSAILMLTLASMIVSSERVSGILVMNVSLFPPVCFMLSMVLQVYMYIRRNVERQKLDMEDENLRLKLAESETQLMLSQIKPHFLYNALIAIHVLCTREPETAAETVMKFATFLRTNMNFISSRDPISFERELEHIRNYADIEQLRFQKRLTLQYDIRTEDFLVPPLSIQPIVENAIRHGACKNISGGTVRLSTWETEDGFLVEVADNGPGFDPKILKNPSSEPHGLQNIIFRLENTMGAEVVIESKLGQGTAVRVTLKKEEAPTIPKALAWSVGNRKE